MKIKETPSCCKKNGVKQGIISGLIAHSGCIAIILFALIGVTAANSFFMKFLSNEYYLFIVFGVSFAIASISALIYIRRFENKKLKTHWKYLSILFSSVIIINLLMVFWIFPLVSGFNQGEKQGELMLLGFELPCTGHIPLVTSELISIEGVKGVEHISDFDFKVYYDPKEISKEEILSKDICKEFNAVEK